MILRELKYEDEENRLTLSGRLSTYNAERLGRINMVGETALLRFGTYSSEKNQWYKYITSGTEGGISARITSIRLTTKKLDNGETYKDVVLIVNPVDTGKNEYLNWQHGGTRQMIWSGPDKKRCGLSKRSFNEIIDSAVLL
jgi:hypothetical protein